MFNISKPEDPQIEMTQSGLFSDRERKKPSMPKKKEEKTNRSVESVNSNKINEIN